MNVSGVEEVLSECVLLIIYTAITRIPMLQTYERQSLPLVQVLMLNVHVGTINHIVYSTHLLRLAKSTSTLTCI